jgi:hypothetical protein
MRTAAIRRVKILHSERTERALSATQRYVCKSSNCAKILLARPKRAPLPTRGAGGGNEGERTIRTEPRFLVASLVAAPPRYASCLFRGRGDHMEPASALLPAAELPGS